MRLHFAAAVATVAAARWLELPGAQVVPVWLAIGLVVCAEALNTAVETVVDLASGEVNPLARRAKDVAAGAVLWAVVVAVAVGLWVFGPHLGRLLPALAGRWTRAPLEVAVVGTLFLGLVLSGLRR